MAPKGDICPGFSHPTDDANWHSPAMMYNSQGAGIGAFGPPYMYKPSFHINVLYAQVQGPPPPFYMAYKETFLIVEGEMEFFVNGEIKNVKAGELVDIPTKTLHTLLFFTKDYRNHD
jgi:mannose-6-phosphate isomerase-like protein (cupin superfamily)